MPKKFKFNLEAVNKYREILEDKELKKYAGAVKELSEAKDELTMLTDEIVHSYADRDEGLKDGDIEFARACTDYVKDTRNRIEDQNVLIKKRERIVSNQLELLVEAMKKRKIVEKLKEKRHDEYKQEIRKSEIKISDDITSTRFQAKKNRV